jgi:hydrogenase maturation protein HypF
MARTILRDRPGGHNPDAVASATASEPIACRIHVRGVVQGVGFRPFVFRLAHAHALTGWVVNGDDGVRMHVEGAASAVDAFVTGLRENAPPAARIVDIDVATSPRLALKAFEIGPSTSAAAPTTRISPDLAVCDECLRELCDPNDRRHQYPYINCTNCGPRFSIVRALPYDRARTTMRDWELCEACAAEYGDPADRRFQAQPVTCGCCGPHYRLVSLDADTAMPPASAQSGVRSAPEPPGALSASGALAIQHAAARLREGGIVAVKGIGGYHLACNADDASAVEALRERKFRKEKPFALMVKDLAVARSTVRLEPAEEALLTTAARPIVLCAARVALPGVAPETHEIGIMLPYTPLHHLLFANGAPDRLVMTSANRSSEPIAYEDDDAARRLRGIADAMLVGERPIARRVDDSVARVGPFGPVLVRRSRGYAPGAVARLAATRPILAVGADLKNTVTLVVGGEAYVSQHVGDLDHYEARTAFEQTIRDLVSMYEVPWAELLIVRDRHPSYASSLYASTLAGRALVTFQHHRAHIASVLAEQELFDDQVIGIAFDGTGYGDDGGIWGGEIFAGSMRSGLERVAHLHPAALPGGDAAARAPVRAAAGFLCAIADLPSMVDAPFRFPSSYAAARTLAVRGVRTFTTTSAGRLFDTVAALTGFTREVSYEGQAACWLEHLARSSRSEAAYAMPFDGRELDWRPALRAVMADRRDGVDPADIARAFHRGLAWSTARAVETLAERYRARTVVLSGGVFQNLLLVTELVAALADSGLRLLANAAVPANDGGISLGQAALASLAT